MRQSKCKIRATQKHGHGEHRTLSPLRLASSSKKPFSSPAAGPHVFFSPVSPSTLALTLSKAYSISKAQQLGPEVAAFAGK